MYYHDHEKGQSQWIDPRIANGANKVGVALSAFVAFLSDIPM
jgi:hypothetical protein